MMKKPNKFIALLLSFLLLFAAVSPSMVLGATSTLTPTDDSYVYESNATSNFGSGTMVYAKTAAGANRYGFMKFNVSGVSNVTSAKLRVYVSASSTTNLTASQTTDSWTEGSITWNTKPATGSAINSAGVTTTAQYVEIDVTSYVASQASSDGIASFVLSESAGKYTEINSSENASNKPELVISSDGGGGDTTAPSAPTSLNATAASSSQINLSWTASIDDVGVTGYDVYRDGSFVKTVTGTSTSDTGLAASTAYSYTVKAKDAAGNTSANSNTASATTQSGSDTTAPSAPTNLNATAASSSQINLSWTASIDNVGVTGYDVYRDGSFVKTVTGASTSDTGLAASTAYSYTVKAKDAVGNASANSNTASATTQSAPTGDSKFSIPGSAVTASADDGNVPANTVDGSLTTRWSASGDGQWIQYDLGSNKKVAYIKVAFYTGSTRTSSFDIQTSTNGTSWGTVSSGVTSAMNNNLQTFDFNDVDPARYVRIVGHGNSSNAWNSYTEVEVWGTNSSGGGGDTTAPSAPTNLSATAASSSQINLSWTASTDNVGVTGYDVYRDGAFLKSVTATSTSDTGLSSSTSYSYTVKAKDAAGNVSANSNSDSATTQSGGTGSCSNALTSASAIQNAMKNASPGAVILIAPGTYTGDRNTSGDPKLSASGVPTGVFYSGQNGTSSSHIVLKSCDPANPAILKGSAVNDGSYGIHITGDYWEIRDVIVHTAQKGIILDNANYALIYKAEVYNVGDEGVHFRDGSSYGTLDSSNIHDVGKYQPGYGEGAYVGSDESSPYEHLVYGNVIKNTKIGPGVTAEHIDIKEGAHGTIVENCIFDGTGISGANSADSFIDVKGVDSIIRYNTGSRNGNANVVDAFQVRTHGSSYPTGINNTFLNNTVYLDNSAGYVVYATSQATGTTASGDTRSPSGNVYNSNVNE